MDHNNPNITPPRWMTDSQREDLNQTARNLADSRRGETLANELVAKLTYLARIYLTEEQQSTLKAYMTDAMNETFSAYKGDE